MTQDWAVGGRRGGKRKRQAAVMRQWDENGKARAASIGEMMRAQRRQMDKVAGSGGGREREGERG